MQLLSHPLSRTFHPQRAAVAGLLRKREIYTTTDFIGAVGLKRSKTGKVIDTYTM